ncbi:unnamed protein product [Didymodactylos carnosus]|uniref:PLAT domain-containing protein n=1 Tax=Didymodactylos carnosus TaxID=1234261 RepID=A0A8S2NSH9_9BILA|nr:unnamed protein product [Didymodactylos carnosus]CAF4017395.1 unnamed protein product [Didymodactylos carnosus]
MPRSVDQIRNSATNREFGPRLLSPANLDCWQPNDDDDPLKLNYLNMIPYLLRMKTGCETFNKTNECAQNENGKSEISIFFKGDRGLTQTISIPLKELDQQNNDIYKKSVELFDVGTITLARIKINSEARWKVNWIELVEENEKKDILNFPVHRWLDTNYGQTIDVMVREGPVNLAPKYTIIIRTGSISSCRNAYIRVALVGDSASTIPFDLNDLIDVNNNNKIQPFRSGQKDIFYISSLQAIDVGKLDRIIIWCDSLDGKPWYCESVEAINSSNEEKYLLVMCFIVNHWFGPDLEQTVDLPVYDLTKESTLFTVSSKSNDISDITGNSTVHLHLKFANGKVHNEALNASETHPIPFLKDNIDFFVLVNTNVGDCEITEAKIKLTSKLTTHIEWNCAWIEIRGQ